MGSACLDELTFTTYRDFATRGHNPTALRDLSRLFEKDWAYTAVPGQAAPEFNPTPRLTAKRLLVAPVNAASRLARLYQQARKRLDVYSELLGNPTLESELAAAAHRGVRVRLIAPLHPNGMPEPALAQQTASLDRLQAVGVIVHTSGPGFSPSQPYMHARVDILDGGRQVFLGSISLAPDSVTFNREIGLLLTNLAVKRALAAQFEQDFLHASTPYPGSGKTASTLGGSTAE